MIPQPEHDGHVGPDTPLLWGAALCIVGLVASLTSTPQLSVATPLRCNKQKYLQTLPNVS